MYGLLLNKLHGIKINLLLIAYVDFSWAKQCIYFHVYTYWCGVIQVFRGK